MSQESREDRFKRVVTGHVSVLWSTGKPFRIPARVWNRPVMVDLLSQARRPQEVPLDDYHPLILAAAREILDSMVFPEDVDAPIREMKQGEKTAPDKTVAIEKQLTATIRQFLECQVARMSCVQELRSYLPPEEFVEHHSIWKFMTSPVAALVSFDQLLSQALRWEDVSDVIEGNWVTLGTGRDNAKPRFGDKGWVDFRPEQVYRATIRFSEGRFLNVEHLWKERVVLMPMQERNFAHPLGSLVYNEAWEPSVSQPAHLLGESWRAGWIRKEVVSGEDSITIEEYTPVKLGPIFGFRGTMIGNVLELSREISADYGICIGQAIILLLTGRMPNFQPSATATTWPIFSVDGSKFLYHGIANIGLNVHCRSRAQTVGSLFGKAQSEALRGENRSFKANSLELFAFVNENAGFMDAEGKKMTWPKLFEGWKAGYTAEQWAMMRQVGIKRSSTKRSNTKSLLSPTFDYRSFRSSYFNVLKRLFPVQRPSMDTENKYSAEDPIPLTDDDRSDKDAGTTE